MNTKSVEELKQLAKGFRREIIRITGLAGSGHPSSSFSALEILTALYFHVLRHDPKNPHWPDRDRFILSKGHAAPGLYTVLANSGYFPVEQLKTLRKFESPLQGHPEKDRVPGVEASTGSLGQGISIGIGMALAARMDKKDYRVYVVTGDGELDEGQIWEAAMFATHYQLDNLTVIVDRNKQQQDSWCKEVMNTEPLLEKWQSFGWYVIDVNGHDLEQVIAAFAEAKKVKGKPTVIIARTVKGKGVSFMENNTSFHGVAPTPEQVELALKELA
ncbi:MAG TPA: transketolase [Nitrospiria bacterium]|nr:transketolase [Nitrospiria bacterium]